jgi:hypothetical protein
MTERPECGIGTFRGRPSREDVDAVMEAAELGAMASGGGVIGKGG